MAVKDFTKINVIAIMLVKEKIDMHIHHLVKKEEVYKYKTI